MRKRVVPGGLVEPDSGDVAADVRPETHAGLSGQIMQRSHAIAFAVVNDQLTSASRLPAESRMPSVVLPRSDTVYCVASPSPLFGASVATRVALS